MPKEKMYLVKREVMAKTIEEAMHKDGDIYSIELAEQKLEDEETEVIGFKNHDHKKNGSSPGGNPGN